MCTGPNPYVGRNPKKPSRISSYQSSLPLECLVEGDRRGMLMSWFERDLSAWEARTGHEVTILAPSDLSGVTWRVDGAPIASIDMSDVVYGRLDLEIATRRRVVQIG